MTDVRSLRNIRIAVLAFAAVVLMFSGAAFAQDAHTSSVFKGVKVNGGTVTHSKQDGKNVLTLSDDFKVPDTPDPHWQVVDSKGVVYQLDRLKVKPDKFNKTITLPAYISDVKKVQIWCSFAEALLGEAEFTAPVM
jgi:hypothetical protein